MPRHLAIGDIHGCVHALTGLIDVVDPRPQDTIITLGDYVDRGPDSAAVLDFVINLGKHHRLVPLRGNHEIMMLDARDKKSWQHSWLGYGGDATLRSYAKSDGDAGTFADIPDAHFDFLEKHLLAYFQCDTHFFVHANADANVPLEDQSDATLYWRRYQDPDRHYSNKIMVCGHTAQQSGLPRSNGHSICIDTWAHRSGWLSCLDVDSGNIWQANEAGETRMLSVDDL